MISWLRRLTCLLRGHWELCITTSSDEVYCVYCVRCGEELAL